MVRTGIDKNQQMMIITSETKIYDYIEKNGFVLLSQIVQKTGLDKQITRKRLSSLIDKNHVSTVKLFHVVDKNKGRTYYYSKPPSLEIKTTLLIESYLHEINNKYYIGILDAYSIPIQFQYKTRFLWNEFEKLRNQFQKKSKGMDYESVTHFEKNHLQFFADLTQLLVILNSHPDSYFMFGDWYDNMMKQYISKMDVMFNVFKTLLGNTVAGGPIKTLIASLMIETTPSGAMKKFGFSPKLGSKLKKELFNDDGSPKIEVINKINEESIGQKEFDSIIPSGETLMNKWKELQSIN